MTLNEFWIWVYSALGSKSARKLLEHYDSPLQACKAGRSEWVSSGIVSEKDMEKAMKIKPEQAQRTVCECNERQWHIILPDSEYYPALLRQIKDFPVVLFAAGNPVILRHELLLASVGTRTSSPQGEFLARSVCKSLSAAGAVIVSGGALGIDSASHLGALDAGKPTVAVLGCGFGGDYLRANEALRERITESGVIITEYLPREKAYPNHFPERNRIISGMCRGTIVTQAEEKSGSLITAGLSFKQGREVFAFPVDSAVPGFSGSRLLFTKGARAITCAYDVLREFSDSKVIDLKLPGLHDNLLTAMPAVDTAQVCEKRVQPVSKPKNTGQKKAKTAHDDEGAVQEKKRQETMVKPPVPEDLGDYAKRLYEYIGTEPTQTDIAAIKAGLTGSELMCALTELELAGIIRQLPGNRCKVNAE